MKKIIVLIVVIIISASTTLANAGFVGPKANDNKVVKDFTIKELLAAPEKGAQVSLKGNIVEQLSDVKYLFKDETGELIVHVDFMPNSEITPKTTVKLFGKVFIKRNKKAEIDVRVLQIL